MVAGLATNSPQGLVAVTGTGLPDALPVDMEPEAEGVIGRDAEVLDLGGREDAKIRPFLQYQGANFLRRQADLEKRPRLHPESRPVPIDVDARGIAHRLGREIDADLLQELAAERGFLAL